MSRFYTKDPDAVLDYYVRWTAWLADDSITTSTWEVASGDVVLGDPIDLGPVQGVWVSEGTNGSHAVITNHIVTAEGREEDRSILLTIKEQ